MPDTSRAAPRPWLINALLGLLCLIWGSTWLVIKTGLRDLPPLWSAGVRFAIAALAMAVLAAILRRREGGEPPPWRLSVAMGLTTFAFSYALVYWSETILPSGVVSVLWAVFPIMQAVAGHYFLPDERLVPRQFMGFGLGFVGIVVLFAADFGRLGPEAIPTAALLLLSPAASLVGNIVVKRSGPQVNSLLLNRNAMFVGAAGLLTASVILEPGQTGSWTASAVTSVAYLAILGTVVTFGIYFWLLRYAPANKMALVAYVTPPIALTLGWALGDEPLTLTLLGGTALVLVGVALTKRR